MVGDRLLTDVVLGKKNKWTAFLVDPLESSTIKKHGLGVCILRWVEWGLFKLLGVEERR